MAGSGPLPAGERPRAEHFAFIVHLLYALHATSFPSICIPTLCRAAR